MLHNQISHRFSVPVLLLLAFCMGTGVSPAADHADSPLVKTDGSLDINDVYIFQSPQNAANVTVAVTVNPFAGVKSPTSFNTRGVYEINIDTDGNAIPNFAYRFYFSSVLNGSQRFIVLQANGKPLASGQTGKTTTIPTGGFVTAGLFDDPFFFDLAGFNNGLKFTGTNFFAGANVTAMVLELPRASFGSNNISVYARTVTSAKQFDRMGRPAINTVLIGKDRKDAFNFGSPAQDPVNFGAEVITALKGLGNTQAEAAALASVLLPDVLTVDTSSTASFLNGRKLADDVIDAELNLLTKGAVKTDSVNANDRTFLTTFPYLAPAQTLPAL